MQLSVSIGKKNNDPVNYYIYLQYYCHPTLYFGCNRKYYFVFLLCSFQFNACEIVIDYTRDTGNTLGAVDQRLSSYSQAGERI